MPTLTEGNPVSISLRLAHDHYTVLVGEGLLVETASLIARHSGIRGKVAAIVTDSNVGPLYADTVRTSLENAGIRTVLITVPAGEASKSMEQVTEVCREMLRAGLDRKSFLVALGGGVVGDLAGFAASIFQRGIPCVQIPTTIVSQVDSSVGGKTGVNTPEGKNLLGAFHQPQLVLADTETLATLHERETTGTRALLNFGHTLGHGIEAAGGYGRFLHGEAISLGLVAATRLSVEKSGLSPAAGERILHALEAYELPTVLADDIPDEAILAAMGRDKKFEAGQIRFVLLKSLGEAYVSDAVSQEDLLRALAALRT